MKKIISAFLVVAFSFVLFACNQKISNNNSDSQANTKPSVDDALNVSIEVPEDWNAFPDNINGNPSRDYISPSKDGKFSIERISIIEVPISEETTLESFTTSNIERQESNYKDKSFEIISPAQDVKAGSFDGMNAVFSYTEGTLTIVVDLTFVVTDNTAYIIMCNTTDDSYDDYKDIFAKARETFKIN